MNLSYARSCAGKQKHASKGAADAHIRALQRRGRDVTDLHAYFCGYCRSNHVGHRPNPVAQRDAR